MICLHTRLIEIPDYDEYLGVEEIWEEDAEYRLNVIDEYNQVELLANKTAMICFAKQLLYFAHYHDEIYEGAHIHYDYFCCKDGFKGKDQLIITKMEIK